MPHTPTFYGLARCVTRSLHARVRGSQSESFSAPPPRRWQLAGGAAMLQPRQANESQTASGTTANGHQTEGNRRQDTSRRLQQLPVRNRLARRCLTVFLSRPETSLQSPSAGSRRTRPFHSRGSAALRGSAGWHAPPRRRPASRTPGRSLRHGSSSLPPASQGL